MLSVVRGHVEVRQNFISEEEEDALFKEVETGLRKKRYEFDHWDDVSTMEKHVNTAIQRHFITKLILWPLFVIATLNVFMIVAYV